MQVTPSLCTPKAFLWSLHMIQQRHVQRHMLCHAEKRKCLKKMREKKHLFFATDEGLFFPRHGIHTTMFLAMIYANQPSSSN